MKRLIIATAALTLLTTGTAFASSCPMRVKMIDDALAKNPSLSAEQLAEVKEYRDQGEKLHNEGKHADSVAELKEAEEILGISM